MRNGSTAIIAAGWRLMPHVLVLSAFLFLWMVLSATSAQADGQGPGDLPGKPPVGQHLNNHDVRAKVAEKVRDNPAPKAVARVRHAAKPPVSHVTPLVRATATHVATITESTTRTATNTVDMTIQHLDKKVLEIKDAAEGAPDDDKPSDAVLPTPDEDSRAESPVKQRETRSQTRSPVRVDAGAIAARHLSESLVSVAPETTSHTIASVAGRVHRDVPSAASAGDSPLHVPMIPVHQESELVSSGSVLLALATPFLMLLLVPGVSGPRRARRVLLPSGPAFPPGSAPD